MNSQTHPDHYATLNVHPDASDAEVKRGYRKLMRAVHPDANSDDPQATKKAAALNLAFETLRDPEKRRAYDDTRGRKNARRYEVWAEQPDWEDIDRKSTRLNSSHIQKSRMPSSA